MSRPSCFSLSFHQSCYLMLQRRFSREGHTSSAFLGRLCSLLLRETPQVSVAKKERIMERRNVLKGAGAVAAVAATGGLTMGEAEAVPDQARPRGIARGLTVLNIRRNGAYELAVKTEKGILIASEAAKSLHMHCP